MKKFSLYLILILALLVPVFSQTAGGQLIVIFPVSASNSLTGEVDTMTYASANVINMTKIIRDLTGADLFEIELVRPYSTSYNTVLVQAKDDQKILARPAIRRSVENMDRYDTIFLGFPNWWATIPMPVATFLESYDFSGKKIIPFCTHGGGRFGQSISAIGKICPEADILEPFQVYYGGRSSLERDIRNWLTDNGVRIK